MNNLRIGILGVSSIAIRKFIPAILKSNNFKIEFVASRSAEKSMKLGKMLKCKYGTYKDLGGKKKETIEDIMNDLGRKSFETDDINFANVVAEEDP